MPRIQSLLQLVDFSAYQQDKSIFVSLTKRTESNLKDLLPDHLKHRQTQPLRILSIGCGDGLDFFSAKCFFDEMGITISYLGIDIDGEAIEIANKLFTNFEEVRFLNIDARNQAEINRVVKEQSIDLVILKHPYLMNDVPDVKQAFISIIKTILPQVMSRNGVLYASFYTQGELQTFGTIEVQGKKIFRARKDAVRTYTEREGTIMSNGHEFVPERFTYVTQSPLEFPTAPRASSEHSSSCCWGALFAVATPVVIAAASMAFNSYFQQNQP